MQLEGMGRKEESLNIAGQKGWWDHKAQAATIPCTEQPKRQQGRCVLSPSSSHSAKMSSHNYNQVLNGSKSY